jgi:hypothetical protein
MAEVFVFGSNLAGRHGAGSAREALIHHGAIYSQGVGRQGDSYAIPTKGYQLERLALPAIKQYVELFLGHASWHQKDTFKVVAIGCGLAGYQPQHIGPFFKGAGPNVILPPEFEEYR